jgi:hypothetical protein
MLTPDNKPLTGSTAATPAVLDVHVPPLTLLLNETDDPIHTDVVPLIAAGVNNTVCAPPPIIVPNVVLKPDVVMKSPVVIGATTIVLPATAPAAMSAVIM